MRPEIIIMLTHHDVTVKNAHEVFEQCKDCLLYTSTRDQMRDAPVGQRNVLCENIVYAARDESCRCALDDVKVIHNKDRRAHRRGLLLAVEYGRTDVGREAVG